MPAPATVTPRSPVTPTETARGHRPRRATARSLAVLAAAALSVATAAAQGGDAPAGQSLGAGLRWQPAIDGADRSRFDLVPLADLDRGPWFARTTRGVAEAGARLTLGGTTRIGAQLAFEPGRDAQAVPSLAARGVGDLSAGASVGVFAEHVGQLGPAPYSALLRVRSHLDSDRGSQADLRFTVGLGRWGAATLGGFVQGTLADAAAMDASFGVSPALAARSGWAPYRAGGGPRQASAGLLGEWALSRDWALQGSLEVRRLLGSAVDSPLVTRPTAAAAVVGLVRTW